MNVELDPHQLKAIEEMHNGSILRGGVGTGKSRTALGYYYLKEGKGRLRINGRGDTEPMADPKDIYVITTPKKRDERDWEDEARRFGISRDRSLSTGSVQLTVDSWNQITKYAEVRDAFFIFDEQRLIGRGTWVKTFLKIAKRNRWIMLSATPGDNWMDYIPVFIANGFYKTRTEFIRRHVVFSNFTRYPKLERYLETRHLEKLRRMILVEMPYTRHTTQHILQVILPHDVEAFQKVWKDRWNIYEERPLKDVTEMFRVARRLVNSDTSRVGELMKLNEKHPKLIVFYNFNYELDILRVAASSLGIPFAEWNGHKHEPIPSFESRWLYLVQYTAGAEGWNCISTNAMVFWSLTYSYKQYSQSLGRIDRMNTPFTDLYYYVFMSKSEVDRAVYKSLRQKKDFNENEYVY